MTGIEARGIEEVKWKVLTQGRLVRHCLMQFGAYLAVSDPLGFNWSQDLATKCKESWILSRDLVPTKLHCQTKIYLEGVYANCIHLFQSNTQKIT